MYHWKKFLPKKGQALETREGGSTKPKKCEEHPRKDLAQNSNVPRSQEDCITQVSGEIGERVTKKLTQEFSRKKIAYLVR